ncbi:MAG TPA: hypothetical protein ENJ65_03780 [Candidatus Tenderia electrophaga]|uniref:Uncharacterized protein n=1 Tax=Candidatus Tenderia electrophaga TaxID=1748243 RepID=A0A832J6R3_9GAMM|nr:hypothetical protein [Candidatus Tenderia electrophaga]
MAGNAMDMLTAVDQGGRPLADFALEYREQIPLERNATVSVTGDGRVVVVVSSLKQNCKQHWDSHCWQTNTVQQRIGEEKLRALVNLFAVSDIGALPYEIEAPPGAAYFSSEVLVGGDVVLRAAGSMSHLEQSPLLLKLRQLLAGFLQQK